MSATPSPGSPLDGLRLLVVEDEFLIQLDIQNILESAGARSVIAAGHVADALTAIDAGEKTGERFDAVVLDLKLDKENALPVAERLTAMGVPFVFLTGAPAGAEHVYSAPVVGKPFDAITLLAALELALAKRG
jgi:DNA-binding response OmpR family regulator